ncbi:hypothetical protein AKJ48_01940 [candidate division MSBL1 archaeon SCGC-AAA261O19]|uniref:HTH arsR-type domain-containing protein n=3 Tax=candidate division MSBL1 TaxID=215777 RepID=A0A133V0C9_9EURY|nr:hypothetical protein AKJ42_02260 [candidate division MSBL1 archaeon SCGC-AAA261C02]KXB04625.1 hypothetical protein AKJ48_01940 [candidate division MSBL1 archaeon SCGC-AAA261O19]KXB09212.1 hypothetical protein AKJ46_00740 [candidate division MSBL1 archaeon SCGC-AAA833K04]
MLDGKIDPLSYYGENARTEALAMSSEERIELLKTLVPTSQTEFSSRDVEEMMEISFRRSKELLKKWFEKGLIYRRWKQNGNVGQFLYRFNS